MNHVLDFPIFARNVIKNALIAFSGSVLIALFANVSIPLFFTPVPLIFQDSIILLLALLLGKRGFAAAALFVFYGCIGLPVFANGAAGIMVLAGPTGGYIIGYLVAAYLVSYLSERQKEKSSLKAFLIMSLGSVVIISLGCLHLGFWVGFKNVLFLGALPFIPGSFIKTLMASRLTELNKWITKQ